MSEARGSKRQVVGLKWARPMMVRPSFIPISRPRGVKALGSRFEKDLEKVLPLAERGKWFEFEDRNGMGWCQVDFLLAYGDEDAAIVVEVKHTWLESAHVELEKLYLPVVAVAMKVRPVGLVIAKRLQPKMGNVRVIHELDEVSTSGRRQVLHWIGTRPLFTARANAQQSVLARYA